MKAIISKKYDDLIVFNNFSFEVVKGQVNSLTGASGKGKTTLLRLLCGLEAIDSGNIAEFKDFKYSYVFQEDRLFFNLSPFENIAIVKDVDVKDEEILNAMDYLNLPHNEKRITEFSGGMKRRIAILRALFAPFDILLLDEPFTGLDEDIKEKCISLIKAKAKGKTIIVSSHDEEDLIQLNTTNKIIV